MRWPDAMSRSTDTLTVRIPVLGRPLRMLIVDDSKIMRRRIERSQQIDRIEVVGLASNGFEAVELFRSTDPDIVTMDITMPEMDGIECVARLVAMKPHVLILVIS